MTRTQYTRNCIQCDTEFTYTNKHIKQCYCSRECLKESRRHPDYESRFWSKVDKRGPDECWPWKDKPRNGYGWFRIGTKRLPAARMAYEYAYRHWPANTEGQRMLACHSCDNPSCCNPAHIFPGSDLDNARDRNQKGRQASGLRNGAYTHPERLARGDRHSSRTCPESVPRGEGHRHAKFSEDQIIEIRQRFANGGESQRGLAREFGVTPRSIRLIVTKRSWSHVA